MKTNDIVGLGNTLMDFLIEVEDSKLSQLNLNKGEFHLVDEFKAREFLKKIEEENLDLKIVPGGSSANCLKGVSLLGGKAIICGRVGFDKHGQQYIQKMKEMGVDTRIKPHHLVTGHAITLITPDAQRTFCVHLGAALEFGPDDIFEDDIKKSKILHLEGYQIEGKSKDALLHAVYLAKKHDTLVSMDLADCGVIRRNLDFLKNFVQNHVDIVFANEDEAREFLQIEDVNEIAQELSKSSKIGIIKLGKKGSIICYENNLINVNAFSANAIDTTGAGDSYAAGFLYGVSNSWDLKKAGELGSLLAAKVVEQKGVGMENIDGEQLKNYVYSSKEENKISKNEDSVSEENEEIVEKDLINEKKEQEQEQNLNESERIKVGIIGGSGLDDLDIFQDSRDEEVTTSYGKPSSKLKFGSINGVEVVLLARHGRDHSIPPTQVNNRANICALRDAGCTHILATTACGSLREEIGRGDIVILDQFIDFTRSRKLSFFEEFSNGEVNHTPMANPFDIKLRKMLNESCNQMNLSYHKTGTVVTIEGPRFSTKAESHMFRMWGCDVINMSIAPESILANEIKIPYAAIAMSTDYDCWKEDEEPVSWDAILEVFKENVENVTNLLINTINKFNEPNDNGKAELSIDIGKEEASIDIGKEEASIDIENEEVVDCEDSFCLKSSIRTIANWPKEGIMFRDITTLLQNPKAFSYTIEKLKEKYCDKNITKIAGIESRGFIFGAVLAKEMGLPFILIRKPGKLPSQTIFQEYDLEYGSDRIEIHKDAIDHTDNVLIVDDLLATGGTMGAACKLVEKLGGNIVSCAIVIDLPDLKGRERLANYDVFSLVEFEGE